MSFKLAITAQKLWLNTTLKEALLVKVVEDVAALGGLTPGMILKKGDWLALTYLQTYKYSKFDHLTWEDESEEIDGIKAAKFKLVPDDKVMIVGGKRQIVELNTYLVALCGDGKLADQFIFAPLIINLDLILGKYEQKGVVQNVNKLKVKNMEVSIGSIDSCTIKTSNNYDGVKKILEETEKAETESEVVGMEITLKDKKDTMISINTKGRIGVASKSPDVNLEEVVEEMMGAI
jgi:hypothetical protein